MDDNSRVNRRSRPRPYDLRRKVLLKNFLREQMIHIPETQTGSNFRNSSTISSEDPVVSDEIEDPFIINKDESSSAIFFGQSSPSLTINNSDNRDDSDVILSEEVDLINDVPTVEAKDDFIDSKIKDDSVVETPVSDSPSESSLFKFKSILNFKKQSSKASKGIFKAKQVCKRLKSPSKTRSFKSSFERIIYGRKKCNDSSTSNEMAKNSSKSLFSLFKHRKEQRRAKEIDRMKKPVKYSTTHVSNKCNLINQSVQNEDSIIRDKLIKFLQSNKRIKEENRHIKKCLSSYLSHPSLTPEQKKTMADILSSMKTFDSAIHQHMKNLSSSLQSSTESGNSLIFHDYCTHSSSNDDNWSTRSKVYRSKSVHEYSEKKNTSQHCYRTRSMSCHSRRHSISNPPKAPEFTLSEVIENTKCLLSLPIMNDEWKRELSESISNVANAISVDHSTERHSNTPFQTLSKNGESLIFHDYCVSSSGNSKDNLNTRPQVSRSKSIHERKNMLQHNHHTRSMNYHSTHNNISITSKASSSKYPEFKDMPVVKRKITSTNLPINNSIRSIQRRSSMPDRTLSENFRSTGCRRSDSVRDTNRRTPFYALPSEAFY